jgi:hypothetical protein
LTAIPFLFEINYEGGSRGISSWIASPFGGERGSLS